MSVNVGEEAPLFTLYNTEKKEVSLKELLTKSNVVLLFFPLAFTSTCTKELCSTRDEISIYEDLNAIVLGISVDSIFTLDKFRQENELPFDLLSDFNKDVSRQYNSLYETFPFDMKGVGKRSAFVIDRQGKIRYAEILEDTRQIPSFEQIKKTLDECQQ